MITTTSTKPETLIVRLESAEFGPITNGIPSLREQFQAITLAAQLNDAETEWDISEDSGRLNQHDNGDGTYRLTASVIVDLRQEDCPGKPIRRITPLYSTSSVDDFSGPGPWRMTLERDDRKKCPHCTLPESLIVSRKD